MSAPVGGDEAAKAGHHQTTSYVGPKGGRGKLDLVTGRIFYTRSGEK